MTTAFIFKFVVKKAFYNKLKSDVMYDPKFETKYGDNFITLVTCEYSQKNWKMVVVENKI